MRALLDVNVLLALFQPSHVHHDRAHQWWEANGFLGWATCPLTENGFVRIVSQPKYPEPIRISEARQRLQDLIAQADHSFWPADISLLDDTRLEGRHILGPRQLTDIYLLAMAVKNGGRLVTFDRSIPLMAVRGAEPRHLEVL